MKWLKAIFSGLVAGFVMFTLLVASIHSGFAPINTSLVSAFLLATANIQFHLLSALLHFAYAVLGSILLVAIFDYRTSTSKGIGLALVLWLILMVIYSPIIGWGIFGAGGLNSNLPPTSPLHIEASGIYILLTLVLHVVYGSIIGWLDTHWINWATVPRSALEREQMSEADLRGQDYLDEP